MVDCELRVAHATDAGRVWDCRIVHALVTYPHAARADWPNADAHVPTPSKWAQTMGAGAAYAYVALARASLADARDDPNALH